eukprot:CAMPEP_0197410662 /NCGR_PEP_ID=MMETSP1165-20131217/31570_1 /TAXON_ID=284809 /ORGANISM="Chrysocystis fragilis, Strain CCMP3189" /LENGTH=166 /DNA_ID=CAMNT_0042937167 /DNA_START=821 /DNA_END=1321 /DNA_ORIENTATION=+
MSTHGLCHLHHFVVGITTTCMYTPECNVIAVMLILRFLLHHPDVTIDWRICKRLLLVAVIVAQKYWDDFPLRNIDFTHAWSRVVPREPPLAIRDLDMLESTFLGALGFDLFVHSPQYFSLRDELVAGVRARERHDAGIDELMRHHAEVLRTRQCTLWYEVNCASAL